RAAMAARAALLLLLLLMAAAAPDPAQGSQGDREPLYRECLSRCERQNCSGAALRHFRARQPLYMGLTGTAPSAPIGWRGRGHAPVGTPPSPWSRPLGAPPPPGGGDWGALGGTGGHWETLGNPVGTLTLLPPPPQILNFPLSQVSLNAWFWSTVFHTRDTALTEKLDYFCASAVVLHSVYLCCVRTLGLQRPALISIFRAFLLLFLAGHISYLSLVRFDYGYNLVANAAAGEPGGTGMDWEALGWTGRHWSYTGMDWGQLCPGRRPPHVWKCAAAVLLLQALPPLELLDFPPLLWVLDAPPPWHIGTIPLNVLFY
ncbi:PGAP3 factor, partial [Pteruthius melanotis]|nr:PGAP3 factor [Pteruthius melanotis]